MESADRRAIVVERLAAEERRREELEHLRARFGTDEQMREALGDQLADQVVQRLGELVDALRR